MNRIHLGALVGVSLALVSYLYRWLVWLIVTWDIRRLGPSYDLAELYPAPSLASFVMIAILFAIFGAVFAYVYSLQKSKRVPYQRPLASTRTASIRDSI